MILITVFVVLLLALICLKVYIDNDYKPLHKMDEYRAGTETEIEITDNMIVIDNARPEKAYVNIGFII